MADEVKFTDSTTDLSEGESTATLGEKAWYVVNTYSTHENKVKENLKRRVESMGLGDLIFRIIVAEQEVPVMKDGMPTDKTRKKNLYPGYVFVEMIMTDYAWYVVRNTPGVTGFVGSSGKGTKPFPVPREQIEPVLKRMGEIDADMFDITRIVCHNHFDEDITWIEVFHSGFFCWHTIFHDWNFLFRDDDTEDKIT